MISAIENGDGDDILDFLNKSSARSKNAIVISTAHKVKGMEWDNVYVGSDFINDNYVYTEEEIRIFYVAITRAKRNLYYENDVEFIKKQCSLIRSNVIKRKNFKKGAGKVQ